MARRPVNLQAVRDAKNGARSIAPTPGDTPQAAEQDNETMPVLPLGKSLSTHYYLDGERQLIELASRDHSRLGLQGLFGRHYDWLYKFAPRHDKQGSVTGWRPELVAESLMSACSAAGIWDPEKRERGRGAWRGENGELLLHTGDRVLSFPIGPDPWREHESHRPGVIGRYVYPAGEALRPPAATPSRGGPGGPADGLLDLLKTWQWRRGEIDAVLLLGWIGAALIGGALDWRPVVWLTGGKGTGKSTLQKLVRLLFDEAIVDVVDTTGAGVWQALRRQTLPVSVDELEAAEDNRKAYAVVDLARAAASGGRLRRGGADHKGVEFVVRSAFLFSSILIPPLLGQDRSRMAILELLDLELEAKPPVIEAAAVRVLGDALRRRLVDGWARFEPTLEHYRASLAAQGHAARGQDQFGTLLTCADLLLHDGLPDSDTSSEWTRGLVASAMAETEDDARDEDRCLAHLLSTAIEPFRGGGRKTIAEWLRLAAGREDGDAHEAQRVIGTYGLRVELGPSPVLAVANYHQGLTGLFVSTHWAGRSGSMGVYVQAFRRLPGAARAPRPIYFAGVIARAVTVPLDFIIPQVSAAERNGGLL